MTTALTRTVAVLGASYGGAKPYPGLLDASLTPYLCHIGANVAQALATSLPEGWRVVVIDRNRCVPTFIP